MYNNLIFGLIKGENMREFFCLLGIFLFSATLLLAEPERSCHCQNCRCTQETHCGCFSKSGCKCPPNSKGCGAAPEEKPSYRTNIKQ